ncbi:MAG: diguanylate cyclase [Planctomycetales bacterium]
MKILIADDDPVSRLRLERTLAKWGYDTIAVRDGDAAWDVLSRLDAPRLALLDWVMPGMDGVEICRRVRQRSAGDRRDGEYTYLLLLTSRNASGDVVEGLRAGADDYLCKPVAKAELKCRLRTGRRILHLQAKLLKACSELRRQATHDPLTGLLNRRAVSEFLGEELDRVDRMESSVGVALIDIDHFKSVNDSFGHAAGDAVLQQVARRLKSQLRPYDRLGRYGGEEFLVVLPGGTQRTTVAHAERLRAAVCRTPIPIPGEELNVTICAGVAVYERGDGAHCDSLLLAADEALYRAKDLGRNRVELASSADAGSRSVAEAPAAP